MKCNDLVPRQITSKVGNPAMDARCGTNALMLAAREGQDDIVRLLLRGRANPNHQDVSGWTALMFAAQEGQTDVVKVLCVEKRRKYLVVVRKESVPAAKSRGKKGVREHKTNSSDALYSDEDDQQESNDRKGGKQKAKEDELEEKEQQVVEGSWCNLSTVLTQKNSEGLTAGGIAAAHSQAIVHPCSLLFKKLYRLNHVNPDSPCG